MFRAAVATCGILPEFSLFSTMPESFGQMTNALFPSGWQAPAMSSARRWILVLLLFVAALINYLDRATISVALPRISGDLLLGPTAKGVLLSAFFWSYALMQVPIGWLADRVSLRWLYAGSFALWSLACGLTGFSGSLGVLILLRVVLGVGESIYLPGSVKFVSLAFSPTERGLPTAIFDSGVRAGLAIGAPLVAWLVSRRGWRNMFMLVGFTALVWVLPWILSFPSRLNLAGQERRPDAPARTARKPMTFNRNLLGASLGFFCFGYYNYLLVTWLPDYLVEVRHLTILKAGFLAAIPYITWAAAEIAGGWASDRMVRLNWNETRVRKGMITLGFATGLMLIPAALVGNLTASIVLLAGGSLVGLSSPNLLVVFQACAPEEEVGMWMGFGNFIGNIGGVLSPFITGLLISKTGSFVPGFALAPIILVAGLLAYWFIVGELKPPKTAT
ncbi:MAG: MFS transporter [Acidobacteria bacterium]|nr:MAG: MFS transporter [Acidobacteriota bacterium]